MCSTALMVKDRLDRLYAQIGAQRQRILNLSLPKGHITNTHNTILMSKIESSYSNQLLFSITYIIDRPVGTYQRYCLSMPSLTYMQTRLGHSTMQCMQSVT